MFKTMNTMTTKTKEHQTENAVAGTFRMLTAIVLTLGLFLFVGTTTILVF